MGSQDAHYKTLGLTTGADEKTIRKAYRRQALRYHPDKNPDPAAADQFRLIQEALEALLEFSGSSTSVASAAEDSAVWTSEIIKAQRYRRDLFQRKAAHETPATRSAASSQRHLQQLNALNIKLRRRPRNKPSVNCKTVENGPVFDTVQQARQYVDAHPHSNLVDSWFEAEYSQQYESQTLQRAAAAAAATDKSIK